MATSVTSKGVSGTGAEVAALGVATTEGQSLTQLALRRLRRDYLTLLSGIVILTLIILSLLAPVITGALDINHTNTSSEIKFLPIGAEGHPLGTDHLGRDHLARLLYAGQISLQVGIVAGVGAVLVGVSIGMVAGYNRGGSLGFIDDIIMWFVTTLNSIPPLMLLILIASVYSSLSALIAALVLISWTSTMRLVRGEAIAHREREYVLSAKAIGAGPGRIMFTHILPNVFSVLIISLMLEIGTLILVESALSFLGLGVRPPTPSWGNMLTNAQTSFRQAAHLSIVPGLLIVTTVLCLYLIGDGLRDAFDPHATRKK